MLLFLIVADRMMPSLVFDAQLDKATAGLAAHLPIPVSDICAQRVGNLLQRNGLGVRKLLLGPEMILPRRMPAVGAMTGQVLTL